MTAEASLLRQFPIMMLVAGILLIVTGRSGPRPRPAWTWIGVGVVTIYAMIWMFKGKRSPPLFGVLSAVCAFYVAKGRRPSKPVLAVTALIGALVVTLAIGWRNNKNYELSLSGFSQYVADFDPSAILVNLNLKTREDDGSSRTNDLPNHETQEYGGFLLMMDTVPAKSDYDYGAVVHPARLDLHPPAHLARQAALRPGAMGQGLDRRLHVQARRRLHGPGDRPPGGDAVERRGHGHGDRARRPGAPDPHGLRLLPDVQHDPLGPGVVGPDLLQRLADDGQRRPVRVVLLHLRAHHAPPAGVPLDLQQARRPDARRAWP